MYGLGAGITVTDPRMHLTALSPAEKRAIMPGQGAVALPATAAPLKASLPAPQTTPWYVIAGMGAFAWWLFTQRRR